MRCARWKVIVAAFGLAVCAGGCTYFAEQPEVYPDKFAPQESDRAWIPKSNQYAIPMQARPPSTLPEPRVAIRQPVRPAGVDRHRAQQQSRHSADVGSGSRRRGCLRSLARTVLSSRELAGSGRHTSAQIFELPGQNAVLKQWQITPMLAVHLHPAGLRPPRRRRSRRARATRGRELLVQSQTAGCGVRHAARVLFDRRGEGGGAGRGTKRRAREDRRRRRQPPRRSRTRHSA